MPPKLTLLLGAVFVCYAFRSAPKRGIRSSPGLLLPTLWYLACASRMLGIWLRTWGLPVPGGGSATDGSYIDASFFLVLTMLGLGLLARRRFEWGMAFRANPWVVAWFLLMAISVLWSGYPFVSFKRYIKLVGAVVMALVVLTNEEPLESVFTVLRRCLYIHLPMSIICIKYFRTIGVTYNWSGVSYAWDGISTSKNDLGQVAMLGLLYFSWEVHRRWREQRWHNLHVMYLLMAIYLLKGEEGSVSMTSVSVGALALVLFLRLQSLKSRVPAARRFARFAFCATMALVVMVLVHSVVMFSEGSLFGQMITTFGRNITLTDRTFIWHDVYAAVAGRPLLGVGFGGFWIGRMANIPWDDTMSWVLGQAHDGYIDTYLQIGWVGVSLMAVVIFATMSKLLASLDEDFDLACFRITMFVTILYVNVTETTLLRGDHHLWFILQLVIWMVPPVRATGAEALADTGATEPAMVALAESAS